MISLKRYKKILLSENFGGDIIDMTEEILEIEIRGKKYYKTEFGIALTRKKAEEWVKKWSKKNE